MMAMLPVTGGDAADRIWRVVGIGICVVGTTIIYFVSKNDKKKQKKRKKRKQKRSAD